MVKIWSFGPRDLWSQAGAISTISVQIAPNWYHWMRLAILHWKLGSNMQKTLLVMEKLNKCSSVLHLALVTFGHKLVPFPQYLAKLHQTGIIECNFKFYNSSSVQTCKAVFCLR